MSKNEKINDRICDDKSIGMARACCLVYPEAEDVERKPLTLDTRSFGDKRENIKLYNIKVKLFYDEDLSFNDYVTEIKGQIRNKISKIMSIEKSYS